MTSKRHPSDRWRHGLPKLSASDEAQAFYSGLVEEVMMRSRSVLAKSRSNESVDDVVELMRERWSKLLQESGVEIQAPLDPTQGGDASSSSSGVRSIALDQAGGLGKPAAVIDKRQFASRFQSTKKRPLPKLAMRKVEGVALGGSPSVTPGVGTEGSEVRRSDAVAAKRQRGNEADTEADASEAGSEEDDEEYQFLTSSSTIASSRLLKGILSSEGGSMGAYQADAATDEPISKGGSAQRSVAFESEVEGTSAATTVASTQLESDDLDSAEGLLAMLERECMDEDEPDGPPSRKSPVEQCPPLRKPFELKPSSVLQMSSSSSSSLSATVLLSSTSSDLTLQALQMPPPPIPHSFSQTAVSNQDLDWGQPRDSEYKDDDYEDDDEDDDEFRTDPEVSYLYDATSSDLSSGASSSSSSISSPNSDGLVSDVVFADHARIMRKGVKDARGVWTLKLRSGCARLSNKEYRVLNWTVKIRTDF